MDQIPETEWIAAFAHRLQRHWRTVDPVELEAVAAEMSHDQHLRAMLPTEAATEWLKPVESAHVHSLIPPEVAEIERFWALPRGYQPDLWPREIFPRAPGPFIRRRRDAVGYERELVVGQWGLIPWFAKEPKLKFPTNNARSEELEAKASYKDPWKRGQRCIIPASTFDEPNWETGKNVWWRFRRADGAPWGLAGLWNTWTDKATGEVHESYTMLTVNADADPLMSRMHKPDPKLAADKQDKRSVIPLDPSDFDQWLEGTVEQARVLMRLAPTEVFDAGPVTI